MGTFQDSTKESEEENNREREGGEKLKAATNRRTEQDGTGPQTGQDDDR